MPFVFMELDITVEEFLNSNIVGLIPIVLVALAAAIMVNRFTSNTVGIITSAFVVLNLISLAYKNKVSFWLKILYFCSTIVGVFTLVKINSRT